MMRRINIGRLMESLKLFLKIYLLSVKEERTGNYISYSGEVGNIIYRIEWELVIKYICLTRIDFPVMDYNMCLCIECLSVFDLTSVKCSKCWNIFYPVTDVF